MQENFYRIGLLPPYVFAEVNKIKAAARAQGKDIIDFGMGNPDSQPPQHVIDKLRETLKDPKVHRYSLSRGIHGLRKAQAAYYARRFGVDLDPDTEIVVTIGSKEGLANLAQAITGPGDRFIVPNPSYPIHVWGFVIAGAEVVSVPNSTGDDFFAAINAIFNDGKRKPVALVVNYPCNPTAESATMEFYERVVALCKQHGVYILSDLAYCELYYDGKPPPSILQVAGAKDIAVEFTTVSKTYSMAGWRIGFAVGNKHLIAALTKIKSYLDYGTFLPVQVAAAAALNGPQDYVTNIREMYKERRDILAEGLKDAGWDVVVPDASMFIWAPVPEAYREIGCLEFLSFCCSMRMLPLLQGLGLAMEERDLYVLRW